LSSPENTDIIQFDDINPDTDEPAFIPIELSATERDAHQNPVWVVDNEFLQKKNFRKNKQGDLIAHPVFRAGAPNKPMPITVSEPLVTTLEGGTEQKPTPFNFKIAPPTRPKDRFKDVVLAFDDIYNQTGIMEGADPYDLEIMDVTNPNYVEGFGARPLRLKFLDMGEALFGRGQKGRHRQATKRKTSKLTKARKGFEADPVISQWLDESRLRQDQKGLYVQPLKKALYILDMNPQKILQGEKGNPRTVYGTKEFSKSAFLAWLERLKNEKTWTDINGKKWSLEEWASADADERVDIAGDGNIESKKGESIVYKGKSKTAKKGTKSTRQWMMSGLKHFLGFHGRMFTEKMVGTMFEKPTPILNYSALRMTSEQLQKLEKCLARKDDDGKMLDDLNKDGKIVFTQESYHRTEKGDVDERGIYQPHEREGEKKLETWTTEISDWEDAYLYFKIALETGWRAYEGLTMTVNLKEGLNPDDDYNTAVFYQKVNRGGVKFDIMRIKFLTRKTWHVKRFTHEEFILPKDTEGLIQAKLDKIQKGVSKFGQEGWTDSKIFDTYGIQHYKEIDGKQVVNDDHALIGYDGKYVDVGTYKFPTTHGLTATKKAQLPKNYTMREFKTTGNELKLQAIIRHCIVKADVDLEQTAENPITKKTVKIGQYWLTNTMHSLRHVFAQYWLWKSDHNFSFVARKGHWAGVKILEEAYGGTDSDENITQNITFGEKSLEEVEQEKVKSDSKELTKYVNRNKDVEESTPSGFR